MLLPVTDHTALFLEHKSDVRALQHALQHELDAWSNSVVIVDDSEIAAADTSADTDVSDVIKLTAKEHQELRRAALHYIQDTPTLFRQLKTARYDVTVARRNVRETLRWRRSMYVHRHGYWMHRGLLYSGACRVIGRDPCGRQTLWLNLSALSRSEAAREEVRLFTVGMLEALRMDMQARFAHDGKMMQCVCVLDLAGVGVSSMDTELAPFVLDLLLNRFPSCFAAVYVHNYSWMYAGVWSLIKRLIPAESRGRVVFPSRPELQERLGVEKLPEDASSYNPDECEFLNEYRQRAAQLSDDDEDDDEDDDDDSASDSTSNDGCVTADEDEAADEDDEFHDAPLWSDGSMQKYADARIAELERQLADTQAMLRRMESQLAVARTPPKTVAIYRKLPTLLYRMGPRQLGSLFSWWWLSMRAMRKRTNTWWTQRTSNRSYLYWLVALLVTRESVATLFGEMMMRGLMDAVHLRGMIA
ncbi:CRAL-TRIO domain-containing protein [Thamnocephalis sphaerospora]|uniref:CRAL-TRIO domain-containing protein n=1 Tax=Thamnocephalis sphaerospora TaxID=78915 RepID=A0A4P9XM32_9FUNG|nr:CRAL-TRIO domain-containing protein [Thamnocephalis sphaerospora]|eukprot:RKP06915.1 CRAL-TRIO domain-containing protein [Thamnocephalis sphaerospora]